MAKLFPKTTMFSFCLFAHLIILITAANRRHRTNSPLHHLEEMDKIEQSSILTTLTPPPTPPPLVSSLEIAKNNLDPHTLAMSLGVLPPQTADLQDRFFNKPNHTILDADIQAQIQTWNFDIASNLTKMLEEYMREINLRIVDANLMSLLDQNISDWCENLIRTLRSISEKFLIDLYKEFEEMKKSMKNSAESVLEVRQRARHVEHQMETVYTSILNTKLGLELDLGKKIDDQGNEIEALKQSMRNMSRWLDDHTRKLERIDPTFMFDIDDIKYRLSLIEYRQNESLSLYNKFEEHKRKSDDRFFDLSDRVGNLTAFQERLTKIEDKQNKNQLLIDRLSKPVILSEDTITSSVS